MKSKPWQRFCVGSLRAPAQEDQGVHRQDAGAPDARVCAIFPTFARRVATICVSGLLRKYLLYLNTHCKDHRQETQATKQCSQIFNLHLLEAKFGGELKWLEKVARAHEFHKESAKIQSEECRRECTSLQEHELLLWVDWKGNWTLPLARASTNDMYWAQSRCEISCLGAVAYVGRRSQEPERIGMVFLSQIIGHTCLACCEQMDEMKRALGPLSDTCQRGEGRVPLRQLGGPSGPPRWQTQRSTHRCPPAKHLPRTGP